MSLVNLLIEWQKKMPVRAGTFAGWFQQMCSAGGAILVIPLIISSLSDADSGLWFTFQGLVALAGLSDFGLGLVVSRQVAYTLQQSESTAKTANDFLDFGSGGTGVDRLRAHVEKIYHYTGAVAVLIGILIYELVLPHTRALDNVSPQSRLVWYLMLATTYFMLLASRWSSILVGANNVFASRILLGLFYLLQAVAVAITALAFKSLVPMALATATVSLIYFVSVRHVARQQIPELIPGHNDNRACLDKTLIRRLWQISMPFGFANMSAYLVSTVQVPMLGALYGPAAVAPFYLAQRILQFASTIVLQPVPTQLTRFTSALAANNNTQALNIFRETFRFIVPATVAAVLGFIVFSPWMAKILAPGKIYPHITVLGLMALNTVILSTSAACAQFVMASGRNPFMVACILNGIFNLIGLAWLVPDLGIIAIPIAAIGSGIISTYLLNYYQVSKTISQIKMKIDQ